MCGRLVNLDTVARVLAEYYHLKTDTQLAALDEALSRVPAETVGGDHEKDHVADPGKMVEDLISRRAAIDAVIKRDANCGIDSAEVLKLLPSAEPEIVRCGQCKYAEVVDKEDVQDGYTCQFHRGSIWFSGSYCSWGERREE